MSETKPTEVGTISWADLTIKDAVTIRDFYSKVVNWPFESVDMGGYSDFCMLSPDGQPNAGICHARGPNANIPAQWLIYITVADMEESAHGGRLVLFHREQHTCWAAGQGRFVVIEDPAGAVAALFESLPKTSS